MRVLRPVAVAIALVVAFLAGAAVEGFYSGHRPAAIPNSWVAKGGGNAVLLQWTQAGSQLTGTFEEVNFTCPGLGKSGPNLDLTGSNTEVSGVIGGGSITLHKSGGSYTVATVSSTQLILDGTSYRAGNMAEFARLVSSLPKPTNCSG